MVGHGRPIGSTKGPWFLASMRRHKENLPAVVLLEKLDLPLIARLLLLFGLDFAQWIVLMFSEHQKPFLPKQFFGTISLVTRGNPCIAPKVNSRVSILDLCTACSCFFRGSWSTSSFGTSASYSCFVADSRKLCLRIINRWYVWNVAEQVKQVKHVKQVPRRMTSSPDFR